MSNVEVSQFSGGWKSGERSRSYTIHQPKPQRSHDGSRDVQKPLPSLPQPYAHWPDHGHSRGNSFDRTDFSAVEGSELGFSNSCSAHELQLPFSSTSESEKNIAFNIESDE